MTHEDDEEFDTKIEPWFVDYHTNGIEQYPIIHTHGRVIARITGGRGMEVAETYAYLFVAAREMQEALENVIKRMEETTHQKQNRVTWRPTIARRSFTETYKRLAPP